MICITGTPGVGKSTVMNELVNRGYEALEFDSLIRNCIIGEIKGEKIVDEDCLREISGEGIFFGHLSHNAKCEKVVVLRAHLVDLEARLKGRGYDKSKIMDNLECEAIDLIGFEAEKLHPSNTYEILNSSVLETADFIENVIKGKNPKSLKIDLTEEILNWY
ncbi:MAG: AAA family ATPase [Thermoplasmatales archaeon]